MICSENFNFYQTQVNLGFDLSLGSGLSKYVHDLGETKLM